MFHKETAAGPGEFSTPGGLYCEKTEDRNLCAATPQERLQHELDAVEKAPPMTDFIVSLPRGPAKIC